MEFGVEKSGSKRNPQPPPLAAISDPTASPYSGIKRIGNHKNVVAYPGKKKTKRKKKWELSLKVVY